MQKTANDETPSWFGNDHPSLRRVWHPIADVSEFDGPGPHAIRLLGDDYALFDTGQGWSLLPDTCPHRLAPLTAGIEANTKADRITVELRRLLADLAAT